VPVKIVDAIEEKITETFNSVNMSLPHGRVNMRALIAADYRDFVKMCVTDTQAGSDYTLPVIDARIDKGTDSQETPPNAKLIPHKVGAFDFTGESVGSKDKDTRRASDEYVMDKIRTYPVNCELQDVKLYSDIILYLSRRAGNAHSDDMHIVESASITMLLKLRSLDITLWNIFRDKGKQHLDGVAASLCDIDGFSWSDGKTFKGQCEHTRNDDNAQTFTKNGKVNHKYIGVQGSVSERDIIAD